MSFFNISRLNEKASSHLFQIIPHSHALYEDYITSSVIDAYELLNMSNLRLQLIDEFDENVGKEYDEKLKQLLSKHKTLTYLNSEHPLTFSWKVNGNIFTSTSLFFEYYMTKLMQVTNSISNAITKKRNNANDLFKNIKNDLLYLHKVLPEWKTRRYIQPYNPYFVMEGFLNQLIYFSHATQALYLANKQQIPEIAFNTARHYYGKIWFRMPIYGIIAQNHYLLATALCYKNLSKNSNTEDHEKKYTLISHVINDYNLVAFKNCYLNDTLQKNDSLVNDCNVEKRTLEGVYYATGSYDIKELTKPKVVELKYCKVKKTFGCQCDD